MSPHCGLFFRENDVLEVDHKIPKSQGGKDIYDNWQLLHETSATTQRLPMMAVLAQNPAVIVPSR
jgi:5-methylcytosine-specific restriction endonuclease McrA